MTDQLYNPVEVILKEEHQHEIIRVGRLIDLSGKQYRFITENKEIKEGNRYDIDYQLVEEDLLWIEAGWAPEIVPPKNDSE